MTLPEELVVQIIPPGGGAPEDISSRLFDLTFGTSAPGGDADCRIGINDPSPHDDALFRAGSKLVITDDQGTVYCGRIEVPEGDYVPGFAVATHLARGYASSADDRIYASPKIWQEHYSIEAIFRESCNDLCADIAQGSILTGDRTLPEQSQDFLFASAQFIWNTVAPLGGDSIPLVWSVYCDPSAGALPYLHVYPRPTGVTYTTAMGSGAFIPDLRIGPEPRVDVAIPGGTRVRVTGDLRQVYNAVAMKIASPNNAPGCACVTIHDSNSQSTGGGGIGTMRMMGIDLSSIPGIETVDAIQAANMMLAQMSTLRAVGTELTLHDPQYVLGPGGVTPLWRVRAGYIIKVVDLDTGDNLLGNELYITGTRYNRRARELTIQVGQRGGLADAVGRSLRARRPGRADPRVADPIPEIARLPRRGTVYDIPQHPGGTNRDVPYAPGDHGHGTPNGDIALTYGLDGVGAAITLPAVTAMGLVQGTIDTWKIRCNPGGLIKFTIRFPPGILNLPGHDPISLPGGVRFAEGSNGSTGSVNLECLTGSEVDVEVTGVPTATWASLILTGTRNLRFSDPLTPLESGTGAAGVAPEPVPPTP